MPPTAPTPPDQVDVAIVGGGLAGLTVAAYAARDGRSVALFERKSTLGGRGKSDVRDGFTFNRGAHALYCAGEGMKILKEFGIRPAGGKPDLGGMGRRDGKLGALPAGPGSMMTTSLLSPRGRAAMASAFSRLPLVRAHKIDHVSMTDWVDDYTNHPDVREILHALGRLSTYVNAPDLVSAGAVVRQLQSGLKGVLYLDHGWNQLVEPLEAAAADHGATIVRGATVESVQPNGSGLRVITADGECRAHAVVVAGLMPTQAADLFGMDRAAFGHAGPPAEAAALDLSLDDVPEHTFVLGIDEPTYFSVHSPPAKMAPDGCAAAVAMKYLPVGSITEVGDDRSDLDALAACSGVTDVKDSRFLRRMTVTGGIPMAEHGGLAGRPTVEVPELPGAFICGDWVGPTGQLVDAAFASARDAARAAARHLDRASVAA